jgi:hypothetical protein
MEILRHKDIIDELVKSGHKVMATSSEEERKSMKVSSFLCVWKRGLSKLHVFTPKTLLFYPQLLF